MVAYSGRVKETTPYLARFVRLNRFQRTVGEGVLLGIGTRFLNDGNIEIEAKAFSLRWGR